MSIFEEIEPIAELGSFRVVDVICGDNVRDVKPEFVSDLVDSIKASGELLQPIAVDEECVLIDGQHRLAAVKELGWERVPVKIVRGHLDGKTRAMLQVMANVTRQEMDIKTASKYYDEYWAFIAADRKRKADLGVKNAVEPSAKFAEGSTAELDTLGTNGETRRIAAELLGFRKEEVQQYRDLERLSVAGVDDDVRSKASEFLERIDDGKVGVDAAWKKVARLQETHVAGPDRVAEAQLAEKSREVLRKLGATTDLVAQTNFTDIAMSNFGSDMTMVLFPLGQLQLTLISAYSRILHDADSNGIDLQRVAPLAYAMDGLKEDLNEFLSANEGE